MKALVINRTSKKDRKGERERSIKDKRQLKLNPDLRGRSPYFDNFFSNVAVLPAPPKSQHFLLHLPRASTSHPKGEAPEPQNQRATAPNKRRPQAYLRHLNE